MVKNKRVYLNVSKTKYCIVKLFSDKKEMQSFYKEYSKTHSTKDKHFYKVRGVSLHYEVRSDNILKPETGIVLLNVNDCGAGIVAHELLHAVLWAYKHRKNKPQYPIVIKNMREEEAILHNHSFALIQFYNWFWKVSQKVKN